MLEIDQLHWCEKFPTILEEGGFDLIIGNPPYIEIKKIRNIIEKKIFSQIYYSAYKLYDIAILFIERALQLLKENGHLSFIITNKFLSTDFGKNIREIILTQSKIRSIIDISYLPVFLDASIYPIILTIEKATSQDRELNLANRFYVSSKIEEFNELHLDSFKKYFRKQIEFFELPKMIFNISANHEIVQTILNNPSANKLTSFGKFAYRILGFTDWNKNVKKITENRKTKTDFRVIGTTNIVPYSINFHKPVRLSGNKYLNPHINLKNKKHIDLFKKPKLLVKEVATELTVAYDPGIFANLTGVYMIFPSDTKLMKILLLVLNSHILNEIFSSLYSGTHLAGGYLRYNGSYLKELPIIIPEDPKLQSVLSKLANYQLFLTQSQLIENKPKLNDLKIYFNKLSNYLIESIYFQKELKLSTVTKLNANLEEINFDSWILELVSKNFKNIEENFLENDTSKNLLNKILNSFSELQGESEIETELLNYQSLL